MSDSANFEPGPSDLLVMKGASLLNKGQVAEAETVFLQALDAEPEHAAANAYLSRIELLKENYDRALIFIDRAIELYPAPIYFLNRAELKIVLGRRSDSIEDLKICIANDRRGQFVGKAGSMLAMHCIEDGDIAGGLRYLDFVIEAEPTHASALALRSICREKLGDRTGAENDKARAVECGFDVENPFAGIFSSAPDAPSPGTVSSKRSEDSEFAEWICTAFLDERAKIHLSYVRHAPNSVCLGLYTLDANYRQLYVDMLSVLSIEPGEVLDLSDVANSEIPIDVHGLVLGMHDFEQVSSTVAKKAEIRYQVGDKLKAATVENTLVELHIQRVKGYLLDHSLKLSGADVFLEAYRKDCSQMPDSVKKRLLLYTKSRPMVEKDVFAALFATSVLGEDLDEESAILREHFQMSFYVVQKFLEIMRSEPSEA